MVTTTKNGKSYTTYDVNHSKADDELYYHNSGGGPITDGKVFVEGDADFWLEDGYTPKFNPGCKGGRRLADIAEKWKQHPSEYGIESNVVYCKICKDHLPTDDVIYNVCDHIHWDEKKGNYIVNSL